MTEQYKSIDLKAFVPSKDYDESKAFYRDVGFSIASDSQGVAFVHDGACSFLLQYFYVKELAENLVMHFQVENVDAWHKRRVDNGISEKYSIQISEPTDQPWQMRDFTFHDPSGVLWRVGQNV
ncbi:VOC family protein [Endozoicomonas elysicola]|uniref:Glyoxalase n=1 Tax=Endozoicomonas elysicola TaxID=305900 RepID=A0A081KDC7_9GAMM|nr:VOC family protein [Endozoicomonas elysicola]KEI72153.1 glyoxalase [Endozoicomonas elysicola]